MDNTKTSEIQHHPSITINPRPQEDQFMYGNEQLLQKLNKKIDRRLDIGYYCQVPSNSRHLIYPQRRYSPSRSTPPKRRHPVKKKLKKADVPQMVDQDQNTSGEFVLKKPDPIVQDNSMQWSYQEPPLEVDNKSLQWSIQPINQEIQYTLESEIIECQDASIQYSFYEPEPEPEPLVQYLQRSMQCEEVKKKEVQTQCLKAKLEEKDVQFDEPKPELKEEELQIDIPDPVQVEKINKMEGRISYLQLEKKKQEKINKKKSKYIEVLKLKEEVTKLQKDIDLTQEKEKLKQLNLEKERQRLEDEQRHQKEKKKLAIKYHNQANAKINQFVAKIRRLNQRPKIDDRWKEQDRIRLEEEKRKEQLERQELENYRKDVQDLTKELKSQMFNRLEYQNDSEEDTVQDIYHRKRKNSFQLFGKSFTSSQHASSMNQLFPNVSPDKKIYVGSIIKNKSQNPEVSQHKMNRYSESVRMTKAYWRQKSSFNYKYNYDSEERQNRKQQYLKKFNEKINFSEIDENIGNSIAESSYSFSPLKLSTARKFEKFEKETKSKYEKQAIVQLTYKNLKEIKEKIMAFFANQLYFKYLYGQTNKIIAGYELFSIFDIGLIEKNSIEIFRYKKYFVFSYRKTAETHFIVIFNDKKSILYSKFDNSEYHGGLQKLYSCQNSFKNFWAYHYLSPEQIYMGTFKNGQKDGYGILISAKVYFQGHFQCNMKEGKGILVLTNGDMYKGDFSHNVFHGSGVYSWANGQKYDGFFKEGIKQGYGKQNFLNGDSYQGFYQNNKKEGKGKYTWKDGSFYEGDFVNDIKSGEGHLTSKDGRLLVGSWQNDSFCKRWNQDFVNTKRRDELPLLKKRKINA